ncbi:hypothetical protein TNCV_1997491 [Trichonephila clavipes]|uniref:Uncharacterized protein n=1 Tax=Trichonephila clavipes TaxID=2585209 RepID=A0A8X6RY04_TRICX|nr:hypothetical protein TNCV_1997491 [Trichonephila clavipes]
MTDRRTSEHLFIDVTGTSRNITSRVIERDTSGEIYYFLEDSRGFRTRQHGCQLRQNGRQSHQIGHQIGHQKRCQRGSTAKISPSSH